MITFGFDYASRHIAVSCLFPSGDIWVKKLVAPRSSRAAELTILKMELDYERKRNYWEAGGNFSYYVEEPVLAGARNLQTTIKLAQTNGMILSVLEEETRTVPVSTWKLRTVGKGNATKDEVSRWLKGAFPSYSAACEGDQDLVDATCIAIYGQGVNDAARALGEHLDSSVT